MTPEQLPALVERVVSDARAIIEDFDLTEAEWYAFLDFVREVGSADEQILLSDVLGLSILVNHRTFDTSGTATEQSVLGPFWRPGSPRYDNPAVLAGPDEPGEALVVTGIVASADGTPLAGAVVDAWQADASGTYDVQDDRRAEAHLRGHLITDAEGRYEIHTVTPPPYQVPTEGPVGRLLARLGRHAYRPAHLHLRVGADGHVGLTTMVFFEGDPWAGNDVIGADTDELRIAIDRSGAPARARFDVVLAPA